MEKRILTKMEVGQILFSEYADKKLVNDVWTKTKTSYYRDFVDHFIHYMSFFNSTAEPA
jgi:hypothetical protein